jgi:hypothetical protein
MTFIEYQSEFGEFTVKPNPHADFITINNGTSEITVRGMDLERYIGECFKRQKISETMTYLEQKSPEEYLPE